MAVSFCQNCGFVLHSPKLKLSGPALAGKRTTCYLRLSINGWVPMDLTRKYQ